MSLQRSPDPRWIKGDLILRGGKGGSGEKGVVPSTIFCGSTPMRFGVLFI